MAMMDLSEGLGRRKSRAIRREFDAYMTPAPLVEAIITRVSNELTVGSPPSRILEPSCGDGEFVSVLRRTWPDATIAGVDIRAEVGAKITALGAHFVHSDFLTLPRESLATIDLIVSNPPYSLMREFITHALEGMQSGATLALLMRFGHLVGSFDMQSWWRMPLANGLMPIRQITATFPIFPRPSFTGSGTDATEYCLCMWRKDHDNGGPYDAITWDKPAPKRGRPRRP